MLCGPMHLYLLSLIIWDRQVNYYWLFIVVVFFTTYEALQYNQLIKGTGDIWDIVTYLLATFIAITLNTFVKKYFYKPKTEL
jgi:hypothetical protein